MNASDQSIRQLQSIVMYSLDHDLLPTAEFTCERLIAQNPSNLDSVHLYSLVLYRLKRYKTAYNLTANHSSQHVGCSYIFGKCALELKQEPDGISALTKTLPLWSLMGSSANEENNYDSNKYQPDNIACYILLAKLYGSVGDIKRSALNYSQVLKLNPFIFEAFEELCKTGVKVKVSSLYKVTPLDEISENLFKASNGNFNNTFSTEIDDKKTGFGFNELRDRKYDTTGSNNLFKTTSGRTTVNYSINPGSTIPKSSSGGNNLIAQTPESQLPTNFLITPRVKQLQMPDAPNRRFNRSSSVEGFKQPSLPTDSIHRKTGRGSTSITSRLLMNPLNTLTGASSTSTTNNLTMGTNEATNAKEESSGIKRVIGSTFSDSQLSNKSSSILCDINYPDQYLMSIYSKIAKGYKSMSFYDCFKAIRIFDSLPENERNTPWVLGKLGRLHFEIVNYEEAENYFIKLRRLDRTRIEEMEYYSTLLWHLHKEMELSFLSHELHEINKDSPEAWIAVGNLFSLKREPDEAIKCFQKANFIDKNFVYSYTLQGHEYLSNDAFENALECFRRAILLDKRHYNAFYGIGMVYLKLGDFRKAQFHFRKAVEINPVNVILICCVGMVLEKLGKKEQALRQYIFASKLQPLSMLALFKKAQSLFSLKQYDLALKDFERLGNIAPDEASVHFLLGKLYRMYGRKNEAIKQFTIALNLDPKGSHLIKEALESLENDEDENQENQEN